MYNQCIIYFVLVVVIYNYCHGDFHKKIKKKKTNP